MNHNSGETRLTRLKPNGTIGTRLFPNNTQIELVGQAGMLYTTKYPNNPLTEKKAIDLETGEPQWTLAPNYSWVAASPAGGAMVSERAQLSPFLPQYDQLTEFDETGQIRETPTMYFNSPSQHNAAWIGDSGGVMWAVAKPFPDATRANATIDFAGKPKFYFNAYGDSQQLKPGRGILLKSHLALEGNLAFATNGQHTAIRIVPDPSWFASHPLIEKAPVRDLFSNEYFTLGAGLPNGADSDSASCIPPGMPFSANLKLTKGFNRDGDVLKPALDLKPLPVNAIEEEGKISSLLASFASYVDNAPYVCVPELAPNSAWNSNSFAHGLLHAAQIKHKEPPLIWPTPGWSLPLPATFFGVQ